MNKKALTERDICTKFITPALEEACWATKHKNSKFRKFNIPPPATIRTKTHCSKIR